MDLSVALSFIMLLACLLAFAVIHPIVRRVPWENTFPRERFKWPVWRWYPILVIAALVTTLSVNVWYTYRASHPGPVDRAYSTRDMSQEVQPVRGTETPSAAQDKAPFVLPPGPQPEPSHATKAPHR